MRQCKRLGIALSVLGLTVAVNAGTSFAAGAAPAGTAAASPSSSATVSIKAPAAPARAFINRPTIGLSQYKALKAEGTSLGRRPGVSRPASPRTVTVASGFNGFSQSGTAGWFPSDSNGAIGGSQIAEIVNSNLVTYTTAGVQTSDRTLNTVANYSAQALFDPRILWDSSWKRWVATSDAFAESSSVQYEFIMISKGSTAAGGFIVYAINTRQFCGGTNPFWDYPQVGMTQDAIVVTGNCFNSSETPETFGVAKSILYNAQGFSTPVFSTEAGTTATPANVYDQRPADVLLTTNQHQVYFQDPQAGFYGGLTADNAISGFEPFASPRSAGQAGCTATSCHLDTSDGRFVNDSSQFGDQLWNVATYGLGGTNGNFATPYWGEFSIANHNTTQFGAAFLDGCSDDFNASLVVSTADKMYLNWTSTDPQGSSCGQTFVRQAESGRISTTPSGSLSNNVVPFVSPAELTGDFDSNFGLQRWGDTSSVSLANATAAWSLNNSVQDANNWGTRWEKMTP